MSISKLKMIGAATLAAILALGGMGSFAAQLGGDATETGRPASAGPGDENRQAVSPRSEVEAPSEEVEPRDPDMLAKKIVQLKVELQAIQDKLRKLEAESQPAAKEGKAISGNSKRPTSPKETSPGPNLGDAADPSKFLRFRKYIIGVSPKKDKVFAYDTVSENTRFLRLPAPNDSPLLATPVIGPGSAVLYLRGRKVQQIAVLDTRTGDWQTQELREPVEGKAIPILTIVDGDGGFGGMNAVAYGIGRYVYAFSHQARRWEVLEVPEGISATPIVGANSVTVEGKGHVFTFDVATGRWNDLDLNKVLDALVVPEDY